MAIVSQQNWLIQKFIMEDILKKLPQMSLNTQFYGIWGYFKTRYQKCHIVTFLSDANI